MDDHLADVSRLVASVQVAKEFNVLSSAQRPSPRAVAAVVVAVGQIHMEWGPLASGAPSAQLRPLVRVVLWGLLVARFVHRALQQFTHASAHEQLIVVDEM